MADAAVRPTEDQPLPLSRATLESIPTPMRIYRADGLLIAANPASVRLLGTPQQLVNSYNLYADATAAASPARAAFARARAGETTTLEPARVEQHRRDGAVAPVWVRATYFPFAATDGTNHFVGASFEDVTAQVDLARQVQDNLPFRALAMRSPDGIVFAEMDLHITYANQTLKAMAGYDDTIIGLPLAELVVGTHAGHLDEVGQALLTRGIWQGEASYRHRNGTLVPIQATILLMRDEAGQPLGSAALIRDITPQRQAEAERAALQEQVIQAQQAALRELSTPLIPLTDTVVVMPLIGAIDTARAQQIMEVLLEGIARNQAEVVLLDISGVQVVDTQVADALLRTAKAARLLGAQVILTGIAAEVAQTIIHLGADLGDIVTQRNLQLGLRYAMERYNPRGRST